MKQSAFAQLLILASQVLAAQPSARKPIPAPLRDLEFGTLNFLHTTDTHGWHAGHLQEESYGADWGDYIDFATRMRAKVETEGNDLLIIDTGDRIEGNGLYDGSEPKGKYTFDIFKQQHMDVICTGNHELYKKNSSENDFNILVPAYHDAYIASNLDIVHPQTGEVVAFAPRFRKFTTKNKGIRVLAFGFLFDFNLNYNNTKVRPVEQVILDPWFQRVIRDNAVDLIIVAAHSAARSTELNMIYQEIRKAKPNTPIQFFAGHQHIRDYKKFDAKAYALASGRFLETIGFQSINGIEEGAGDSNTSSPIWFRRYIDNNLYSFYHHSDTNASTFHSIRGRNISRQIDRARKALGLDENFGCSPTDLWMSRSPFPANDSIYSWLNETVFPDLPVDSNRSDQARLILVNSGAIRFDIFKGPFTKDSQSIVSPFTSGLHYIKDIPLNKAINITTLLNRGGQVFEQADNNDISNARLDFSRLAPPQQRHRTLPTPYNSFTHDQSHAQTPLSNPALRIFPGYTTTDDLGTEGDDTVHAPIRFYFVPNVFSSYVPSPSYVSSANASEDKVDLIFNEYLDPFVILALGVLGEAHTKKDIETYLYGSTMTDLITTWIQENWDKDC